MADENTYISSALAILPFVRRHNAVHR